MANAGNIDQPVPGTSTKVQLKLAKGGVPRPVTGPSMVKPVTPKRSAGGLPILKQPAAGRHAPLYNDYTKGGGRDQSNAVKAAKKAVAGNRAPVDPGYTPGDLSVQPTDTSTTSTAGSVPGYGSIGNGTAQANAFDPMKYAQGMAGMKYDPAITQMAGRISGIINALPGSLDSLHKAFANLDAYAAAPPTQGVVGGPTTQAGNTYAATTAGINNPATAALAAGAASREADWSQRISRMSAAQQFDLGNQLSGLTLAKGDAQSGYYQQGIKTKSDLVSRAIANVNSIRASDNSQRLVDSTVKHADLVNAGLGVSIDAGKIKNAYTPIAEALSLKTQQLGNQLTGAKLSAAQKTLKTQNGPKTLLNAATNGGPSAMATLTSSVIPSNGVVQDPNNKGQSTVYGNPNTWLKQGTKNIMRMLPQTKPENARKFAQSQIALAISAAHSWNWDDKSGKFIQRKA